MENNNEQPEKTIDALQQEVTQLKQLLAICFKKIETNFESVQMNIGMIKRAKLTDEIKVLSQGTSIETDTIKTR